RSSCRRLHTDWLNSNPRSSSVGLPEALSEGMIRELGESKAIMTEVDGSLRRLGMDYIDLYQIHRWDYQTPIKETLEALHDLVKAGKAFYAKHSALGGRIRSFWSARHSCRYGGSMLNALFFNRRTFGELQLRYVANLNLRLLVAT